MLTFTENTKKKREEKQELKSDGKNTTESKPAWHDKGLDDL